MSVVEAKPMNSRDRMRAVLSGTLPDRVVVAREKRFAEGIPIDDGIWAQIVAAAEMEVKAL